MTPAEFDWWFDRNPAGPRILNAAREEDGAALGVLAMSFARMDGEGLAAFAVHAVTRRLRAAAASSRPSSCTTSRRRRRPARLGARLHEPAGRADPRRQAGLGGRRPRCASGRGRSGFAKEGRGLARRRAGRARLARAALRRHHVVRDAEYLSWRYADSPRRTRRRRRGPRSSRTPAGRASRRRSSASTAARSRARRCGTSTPTRRCARQPRRGTPLPRCRLRADAAHDPLHRQAADRRCAAAPEEA